jgi:hypothetical protein
MQAKAAIMAATGLPEDAVTATILPSLYIVTAETSDAPSIGKLKSMLADSVALQASLESQGMSASAAVVAEPPVLIKIETTVDKGTRASDVNLANVGSNIGGAITVTDFKKSGSKSNFTALVDMADPQTFDLGNYIRQIAEAWGVDAASVQTTDTAFQVGVEYLINPVIPKASAKDAVVAATGLPACNINTTVVPSLVVGTATAADVVKEKMEDTAAIKNTLLKQGVKVQTATVVTEQPVVVKISTAIAGSAKLQKPTDAQIEQAGEQLGATISMADVAINTGTVGRDADEVLVGRHEDEAGLLGGTSAELVNQQTVNAPEVSSDVDEDFLAP